MDRPFITPLDPISADLPPSEDLLVLFNDRAGATQMRDLVLVRHAFVTFETWETVDEQERRAFLLLVRCETADAEELMGLVTGRLPDYIQVRRFPPSRLDDVRRSGTRVD